MLAYRNTHARGGRLGRAALVAVLVLGSTLIWATPADARPTGPLALAEGAYFGAVVNPDRSDPDGSQGEILELEADIGRTLDIDHRFYEFRESMPTQLERWDVDSGRIPLITWGAGIDTIRLASGLEDTWIRAQASRMADFGDPIFLRYYHEFDTRSSNILHTPADFIAAWRHVHDLFLQEGATNVVWVWCPTAWAFQSRSPYPPNYYPGADYVDFVAVDGYNWYPAKRGSQWRSFSQVFRLWYDWAITTAKPLMIAEVGVLEDPAVPGRRAAWIADMQQQLKTNFSEVQAVLYFDTSITKSGVTYDWRFQGSASAYAAYAAMGADPYFNPSGDPPPPPPPPTAVFENGFDDGFAQWTTATNLTLDAASFPPAGAAPSARAAVSGQAAFAQRTLGATYPSLCMSVAVNASSIGSATVPLVKMLTAQNRSVSRIFITSSRALRVRSDVSGSTFAPSVTLPAGWNTLELCTTTGTSGTLALSLNGTLVRSWTTNLGTTPLGRIQIGDDQARTITVNFDDVLVDD